MQSADTFEIKKGVPLPARQTGTTYPFAAMQVGDCFDVAAPAGADAMVAGKIDNRVRTGSYVFRQRYQNSWKFTVRIIRDGESCTIRCWRTA